MVWPNESRKNMDGVDHIETEERGVNASEDDI